MSLYVPREVEVFPKSNRLFDVPDGAMILAAEYRGPNRVVLTVAERADFIDGDYCVAVKDNGEQCSRERPEDELSPWYCYQHDGEK